MPSMHTNPTDISFTSGLPLHTQIADYFRRQIAQSRLCPGERLPAIRRLALHLKLDPGTVARAYRELEQEGTITSRRGGGSHVAGQPRESYLAERQQKFLGALLERTILQGLGLGFSVEDIQAAFAVQLAQWRERRARPAEAAVARKGEIRFSGSHDLAVELLVSQLLSLYPETNMGTSFVGSLAGLMALESGEADIAGAHLMDAETGEFNIPFVKRLMPNETVIIINLVQRVQGLMVAAGNPREITSFDDLKRAGIIFVNRQKGSGTRILLDSRLLNAGIPAAGIRGYRREEKTHVAVATLIAEGQADVGLGAESAARAVGLDFIPVLKERYDLVALKENFDRLRLERVLDVLRGESFRKMLGSLPGYDLSETGSHTVIAPESARRGNR